MKTFSMIAIIFLFISTAQADGFEFNATDASRIQNNCGAPGRWAYAHNKGEIVWSKDRSKIVIAHRIKKGALMRHSDFKTIGRATKITLGTYAPEWLKEFSYKPCNPVPPATIGNVLQ